MPILLGGQAGVRKVRFLLEAAPLAARRFPPLSLKWWRAAGAPPPPRTQHPCGNCKAGSILEHEGGFSSAGRVDGGIFLLRRVGGGGGGGSGARHRGVPDGSSALLSQL